MADMCKFAGCTIWACASPGKMAAYAITLLGHLALLGPWATEARSSGGKRGPRHRASLRAFSGNMTGLATLETQFGPLSLKTPFGVPFAGPHHRVKLLLQGNQLCTDARALGALQGARSGLMGLRLVSERTHCSELHGIIASSMSNDCASGNRAVRGEPAHIP